MQSLCYMQFCLKESDMLPHEITSACPGREWHHSIYISFHVAWKLQQDVNSAVLHSDMKLLSSICQWQWHTCLSWPRDCVIEGLNKQTGFSQINQDTALCQRNVVNQKECTTNFGICTFVGEGHLTPALPSPMYLGMCGPYVCHCLVFLLLDVY